MNLHPVPNEIIVVSEIPILILLLESGERGKAVLHNSGKCCNGSKSKYSEIESANLSKISSR
jgi:uncharacterized protein (DUF779 family)